MKNIPFAAGFTVGILIVAVFCIVRSRTKNYKKDIYDERQLIEQGKAAKWAMYTLVILNILYGAFSVMIDLINPFEAEIICSFIGVSVYAAVCIYKEAYFPVNKSMMKYVVITVGIGVINFVIGFIPALTGGSMFYEDGSLREQIINIAAGLMCVVIPLVAYVKIRVSERECYEDSDEDCDEECNDSGKDYAERRSDQEEE